MANSNNNTTALAWSSSSPVTMSNNTTRYVSDAVSINADAVQGAIRIAVDNQGTPAAGDVVDVGIVWSVDGTNYDSDEHAMPLGRLDTVAANTPGEDPASKTFSLNVSGKQKFKLVSLAPQSASRNIQLSATYNEHRMS